MSNKLSYIVQTGELDGSKIKIEVIQNDGLQESVTIINRGTIGQPMAGWVLASLRGQAFYLFPEDLILRPACLIVIHSGQKESQKKVRDLAIQADLLWSTQQIWNNHSDTAVLFDANGLEIDRYSYPHNRVMGSSANRRKELIRNNDGFVIGNESLKRTKKVTRK
jgi:hypothetical protein